MKKNLLSGVIFSNFLRTSIKKPLGLLLFSSLLLISNTYAQNWEILGNESQIATAASAYTTIVVQNNVPYVAFTEGGIARVKKMISPSTWQQVGPDLSTVSVTYTRIYSDKNNKLYVTYIDNNTSGGSKLVLLTYNVGTNTWDPLVAGNPYVSTGSVAASPNISTQRTSLVFDNNSVPYVAFTEVAQSNNVYVRRFVNGAWETLGGGPVSADFAFGPSIAIDNLNVPYLVYLAGTTAAATTGNLTAYRYNLTTLTWDNINPPNPIPPGSTTTGQTTGLRHTNIVMDSTFNPIVSYFNTGNSNRSSLARLDKSALSWTYLGTVGTRDAPYNSSTRDVGGNVYNSFQDALTNGGTTSLLRVFKLSAGSGGFVEVKSVASNRGIDSPATWITVGVGLDTSRPYVVYVKTNTSGVATPIVQIYNSGLTVASLPVKLGDITATKANGQTILNWKVYTEVNAGRYTVERSSNGFTFSEIGSVNANGGSSYSLTDYKPVLGNNFYRLKSIDKDNAYTYSKVLLVDFSGRAGSLSISPNPVSHGFFTVRFGNLKAGKVSAKLYSTNGQLVMDQPIDYNGSTDNQLINLPSKVSKGIYQLVITDGANSQKTSVVVQ